MTGEEQRGIAKYYIASFAYSKIFGCTWALDAFRENRCGNTNFPLQVKVNTQYQDEKSSFIAHYEEDGLTQTPSVLGSISVSGNCTLQESNFLNVAGFGYPNNRDKSYNTNNVADFSWTGDSEYAVEIASPMDATSYSMLSFRIMKTAAPSSGDIDVALTIQDASGTHATFSITDYASIWNPADPTDRTSWVMQTVSIPLTDIHAAGIDLSEIKKITLDFSDQCTGQVYMDDLQFSE
ncbi:MAG: hypothetical protein L3J79_09820 [Candidatus Marinimicrobia bacterium]|nr:hypothetical protein [Candidatus Neomarinimicrobiota bacterium]